MLVVIEARPVVELIFVLRFVVGWRAASEGVRWPGPLTILAWWMAVLDGMT